MDVSNATASEPLKTPNVRGIGNQPRAGDGSVHSRVRRQTQGNKHAPVSRKDKKKQKTPSDETIKKNKKNEARNLSPGPSFLVSCAATATYSRTCVCIYIYKYKRVLSAERICLWSGRFPTEKGCSRKRAVFCFLQPKPHKPAPLRQAPTATSMLVRASESIARTCVSLVHGGSLVKGCATCFMHIYVRTHIYTCIHILPHAYCCVCV